MKQIFSRLLLVTLGFIIPLFMVEFGVRLTNLALPLSRTRPFGNRTLC